MRLTEQDIDRIDAYLAGELSGEELVAFELRVVEDAEFGEEVRMMEALSIGAKRSVLEEKIRMLKLVDSRQSIDDGLIDVGKQSMVHGLSTMDSESKDSVDHGSSTMDTKSGPTTMDFKGVRGLWKGLAVAASILLIGTLGIILLDNDELLIKPFPNLMTASSGDADQLTKAMSAYSNEQYATALELFNGINENELNTDISFYQSISALMIGQLNDAEKYLSQSDASKYPVSYYQGMIDLKRGKEISNLEEFCACKHCPPFLLSEIAEYCLN